MSAKIYKALGLMSGSSLDGLDLAFCEFKIEDKAIAEWKLIEAETIPFEEKWISRLAHLPNQSALIYAQTHAYLGHYFGQLVNQFLSKKNLRPDFIASHGHTIFHYPDKRMTAQIGDGAAIAAVTGHTVISDFRTQDVAINGEGAPLAPTADLHLFQGYDFYLNIGGIANVSCNANGKMIAFDIGGANQIFDALARLAGKDYDDGGQIAASGKVVNELLQDVNSIPYFSQKPPKSLDNQWVVQNLMKRYFEYPETVENRMRTAVEQLAQQTVEDTIRIIKSEGLENKNFKMFPTGGGVFNSFLMERMQSLFSEKIDLEIVMPSKDIIQFKEAILMGLLGVLRMEGIPNCLGSATGAERDTIGGAVYFGRGT